MTFHSRAALILGSTSDDVKSFSILSLRDLLRSAPASTARDLLIADINNWVMSGFHITGKLR